MNINREYIEQFGTFLDQFKWDWFATYSFATPVSQSGAVALFRKYTNRLSDRAKTFCHWSLERQKSGVPHIHALVGGTGNLSTRCREKSGKCEGCGTHLWKHGFVDIHRYDPAKAGRFYVLKEINRYGTEWDFWGEPKYN